MADKTICRDVIHRCLAEMANKRTRFLALFLALCLLPVLDSKNVWKELEDDFGRDLKTAFKDVFHRGLSFATIVATFDAILFRRFGQN
jgi:hypothetical protein